MAVGADGAVYIADAGVADRPGSGRLARVAPDGALTTVLGGIGQGVGGADNQPYLFGLSDVAVGDGGLYLVLGLDARASGQPAIMPNRLIRRAPTGDLQIIFDFARLEQQRNPDGRGPDTNATGVAVAPDGGLWVSDGGGNWVARLTRDGAVSTVVAFPAIDDQDAVPAGLTVGPDGDAYVTLFRCQSPTQGKGGVARVRPDGSVSLVATGLTNPVDVVVDAAGTLYVLEFGVDYRPATGRLLRLGTDGSRRVLAERLTYPTGLARDTAGRLYVVEMSAPLSRGSGGGRLTRVSE